MAFNRAVILGSNGWFDTDTGHTLSILLEYDDCCVVLDAGSGFSLLDRYLADDRPVFLFLSHFHLDHIIGLHSIHKFSMVKNLTVFGQPGTRDVIAKILAPPFSAPFENLPFCFEVLEVPADGAVLPFEHRVAFLDHADPCLGLRIDHGGRSIAFCTDTGYCENALDLARGVDLLFTECAYPSGFERPEWPHLNPESAARIALEAGAGKLVLVHFDAHNYQHEQDRLNAEKTARKTFAPVKAGFDFMEITL